MKAELLLGLASLLLVAGCEVVQAGRPVVPTAVAGAARPGLAGPAATALPMATPLATRPAPAGGVATSVPMATPLATRPVQAPRGASTPAPMTTPLAPRAAVSGPPGVPHTLAGRADCMGCHSSRRLPVPRDHAQRSSATCLGCHGLSSSAPRPTPRAATHKRDGYEGCLVCHMTGTSGALPVPASHAGRFNDSCLSCHRLS